MQVKLFGSKVRLEIIVACIIIGAVGYAHMFCGCATKEGMQNMGAALNYCISNGVHNKKYNKRTNGTEMRQGPKVPLPEGQLFYWANNEVKPECCHWSSVSGSNGCVCMTKEQERYLQTRGGNRSHLGEY